MKWIFSKKARLNRAIKLINNSKDYYIVHKESEAERILLNKRAEEEANRLSREAKDNILVQFKGLIAEIEGKNEIISELIEQKEAQPELQEIEIEKEIHKSDVDSFSDIDILEQLEGETCDEVLNEAKSQIKVERELNFGIHKITAKLVVAKQK